MPTNCKPIGLRIEALLAEAFLDEGRGRLGRVEKRIHLDKRKQ